MRNPLTAYIPGADCINGQLYCMSSESGELGNSFKPLSEEIRENTLTFKNPLDICSHVLMDGKGQKHM